MTKRLVVLISGNGSNLQAILDACVSGELPASVVCVISNKADAFGLSRARNVGIEAVHFAKLANETRQEYDKRLSDYVTTKLPDYIILAGWMRILSSSFLSSFPNKVVNLHPALPDTFPGTHAIERAFEAFQRGEIEHTGVMVHLVPDEGVDDGPVLAAEIVPIHKEDTLATFETRVHHTEHRLLVKTLKAWLLSQTTWNPVQNGTTIGATGSENGIIVLDEFHNDGGRITLERDGVTAPWTITCGGGFVHTVFFRSKEKAENAYRLMKFDLWNLFHLPEEDFSSAIKGFVNKYQ
jgi:formyltetrahydrofolate-dependent phosphoribosylglycinamide formyltransferase